MKLFNPSTIASLVAICATSIAHADTVIHFTGSTAFRTAAITAIENVYGAGNFKAAYQSSSGASEKASNQAIFQGTISGLPAGANPVTIKCSWSGSVGGIKTVVQNLDVTTWMAVSNLPGTNTVVGVASPTYSSSDFTGETAKADVTMSDSARASTGFNSGTITEQQVGVVPFEWVACNGSPTALSNITPLLAQALLSGGMPLSQFTGNTNDSGIAVYAMGRDFDSGTRLSELAENGIGVFGSVQQVKPTISGTAGAVGSSITELRLWPAETVLGQSFSIGQSGFSSGGTLADNLATPGSTTAATPSGSDQVLFGPGYLVAYLGRNDATRACKTTSIAGNTAHRLTWNGVADWNGPILSSGAPTSYNDAAIQEGLYTCWEYEYLTYRGSYSGNGKTVADKVATQVKNTDAVQSGLLLSTMNVSKPVEGGLVTHN